VHRPLSPYQRAARDATVPAEVTGPDVDRVSIELSTARRAADPNKYKHA
jgi:hypothetical protein